MKCDRCLNQEGTEVLERFGGYSVILCADCYEWLTVDLPAIKARQAQEMAS